MHPSDSQKGLGLWTGKKVSDTNLVQKGTGLRAASLRSASLCSALPRGVSAELSHTKPLLPQHSGLETSASTPAPAPSCCWSLGASNPSSLTLQQTSKPSRKASLVQGDESLLRNNHHLQKDPFSSFRLACLRRGRKPAAKLYYSALLTQFLVCFLRFSPAVPEDSTLCREHRTPACGSPLRPEALWNHHAAFLPPSPHISPAEKAPLNPNFVLRPPCPGMADCNKHSVLQVNIMGINEIKIVRRHLITSLPKHFLALLVA